MYTDSHCHLDHAPMLAEQGDIVARARAAGVSTIINIVSGCGVEAATTALATAERYDGVYAVIGVHPHDAAKASPELLAQMKALAGHPKLVAWGEIGLDYFYDHSPRDIQQQVFEAQLEMALQLDLPFTLHVRDAAPELLATLRNKRLQRGAPLRGIWHCFSEGPDEAAVAVELGLYVSFSGIVTYKKATAIATTAAQLPLDRLLVETDSPFLSPTPHRGKRNEPAFVVETVRFLAHQRGLQPEELAAITTRNAQLAYEL